jgi:drug/metabolite transporter (DMT)-like permease
MSLVVAAHARSENLRGIFAMLASTAVFVINDTLLKLATEALSTGEAIFLRGIFTTLFCTLLFARHGRPAALPSVVSPRIIGRAVAEVGSTLFFLSALARMPIGDATAILQFTPLAITAGAALFLGERVGWQRWLATCIGLVGVLIIVRPGGAAFNPYSVLALLSILFGVARDLLTRGIAQSVPSLLIAGISSAAVTLASLGFVAFEAWAWPSFATLLLLVASGAALVAGQYWLITAMRTGEIAVVAPFRYSVVLWAILAGYLVWREAPGSASPSSPRPASTPSCANSDWQPQGESCSRYSE